MVVPLANRIAPPAPSLWRLLLVGSLCSLGCSGAEFSNLQAPRDADATPMDGSSTADESGDVDWEDGREDGAAAEATGPSPDAGITGCTPGEVRDIVGCTNCGRYVQICNERRTWDPPFCRQAPDACAPGTMEQRSCEGDGTQKATCTSSCTWMLDTCLHSVCMPNQVEKQPCGHCGAQSRSCELADGGWKWTPFSTCSDEKACAPSQIDRESCGRCGTRSRVCDNQCAWSGWSSCQDEGECSPGDVQERGCVIGLLKQTRTCSDRCVWGDWMGLCL
jgi:hypothetical protein